MRTNDATRANAEAMPFSFVPTIEPDKLSMFGLYSLYDALGTVYQVVAGLASQPRFTDGETLPLHGDMLQQFQEYVAALQQSIRDEASNRDHLDDRENRLKLFFLTCDCADGFNNPERALKDFKAAVAKIGGEA